MNKDLLIILAWPEGMTTAAGAWYDKYFAKNGKYRVGHSALVLVNSTTRKLHYFDFGRYHTPLGFGRIRDSETDPDISINQLAETIGGENQKPIKAFVTSSDVSTAQSLDRNIIENASIG